MVRNLARVNAGYHVGTFRGLNADFIVLKP